MQSVCDKESGQDLLIVARRRGTGSGRAGTDRLHRQLVRRGEGGRQQGGRGAVGVKRVVETKMRLPKHKMPKEKPVKAQQTVKHKKSEKKAAKLAKWEAKSAEMEVQSVTAEPKYASEAECLGRFVVPCVSMRRSTSFISVLTINYCFCAPTDDPKSRCEPSVSERTS